MSETDWTALSADEAVERLLEEHGGIIHGLGLRMCGNAADAEDLVQQTFLQAWRAWDGFEGRSKPQTWLYAIASRVCTRFRRRRAGEPKRIASLERLLPFGEKTMVDLPDPADGPLDDQVRREAVERLEAAVASLPETHRLPLVLKDILGFPIRDIAGALGLKESTVKTRLHRARLRLREEVARSLPRREGPPPEYSRTVCLDLLRTKQEALDRGVAFPVGDDVTCERCRAVFATMDLAKDLCADLRGGHLPEAVRDRVRSRVRGRD